MRPRIKQVANRSDRGSVVVEYALILPVLLLLVLGIGNSGRLLWINATLSHAVNQAARCGAITGPGCANASQTADFAVTQAYGLSIQATAFTISAAACGYQVDGSYAFTFIIPWPGASPFGPSNGITISATACYPT